MDLDYLHQLQKQGIEPNFWCSQEYFRMAGLYHHYNGVMNTCSIIDLEKPHVAVLPPVSMDPNMVCRGACGFDQIWSDFPGSEYHGLDSTGKVCGLYTKEFLDYEYIYDPKAFADMSGGKWMVFRKNSRKWPRTNPNTLYRVISEYDEDQVREVFMEWLEARKGGEEIHDDEVMMKYVFGGEHREGLFRDDGTMMGMNIWDDNYMYVNYRYCFCRPEPWLSEYMRLQFYLSRMGGGKLVNDGGSLGNDNLRAFKLKLNPVKVREVHSWTRYVS